MSFSSLGISIGFQAGQTLQQYNSIAIGSSAGANNQGQISIAIGSDSGSIYQSQNSIAIGYRAAYRVQHPNSIVINATGSELQSAGSGTLVIQSLRQVTGGSIPSGFYQVAWNPTTGEMIVVTP